MDTNQPGTYAVTNPEVRRQIGRRYAAGESAAKLAALFHISITTVRRYADELGVSGECR